MATIADVIRAFVNHQEAYHLAISTDGVILSYDNYQIAQWIGESIVLRTGDSEQSCTRIYHDWMRRELPTQTYSNALRATPTSAREMSL